MVKNSQDAVDEAVGKEEGSNDINQVGEGLVGSNYEASNKEMAGSAAGIAGRKQGGDYGSEQR